MTRSLLARLCAALLASALLLGACGDDDGDDAADVSVTTEAADEDDAADEAEDDGEDAGEGEDEGGDAATSAEIRAIAEVDDFCELETMADESEAFDVDGETSTTEERAEAAAVVRAYMVRMVDTAPAEIEGDVTLVGGVIGQLYEAYAAHDFDSAAMMAAAETDPAVAAVVESQESPEFQAASDKMDAWSDANC